MFQKKSYFCNVEKYYEHIEKLLATHEYVAIPGIGGFTLHYEPAVVTSNTITAPRKSIAYNALLPANDALLAMEIARSQHISFRLAQEELKSETAAMIAKLQTSAYFQFGNLGTFTTDSEKRINFVPNQHAEFIPFNFGLHSIQLPEKLSIKQTKFFETKHVTNQSNWLRYAAMLAIVLGMLFISTKTNYHSVKQTASIFDFTAKVGVENKIALTNTVTKANADNAPESKINTITGDSNLKKFHVVVACLTSLHGAEAYKQELLDLDYSETHIMHSQKTYRVAIESFSEKQAAIEYMEALRYSNPMFEQAWVFCEIK